MVTGKEDAARVIDAIRKNPFGKNAAVVGEVTGDHPGMAWMDTVIGGKRIIEMLSGQQLPRIC